MTEEKLAKIRVSILPVDASDDQDRLNESGRQLYEELRETKAEDVKLVASGERPKGAKGLEGLVAELAVSFVAHYAPEVIDQIRRWVKRSPERKVKLTSSISGKEVTVVISSEDMKTQDVDLIVKSLLASFG